MPWLKLAEFNIKWLAKNFQWNPKTETSIPTIPTLVNEDSESKFPHFILLIECCYDEFNALDTEARTKVDQYLALIANRGSGKSWTAVNQ